MATEGSRSLGPSPPGDTVTADTETTERVLSANESPGAELLELLSDEYVRRLLAALEGAPRPACDLVRRCDMSKSTIYRRLNRLQEHGLVSTHTEIDPDGHHRKVYEARLERVTVEPVDEDPTVRIVIDDRSPERRSQPVWLSAD